MFFYFHVAAVGGFTFLEASTISFYFQTRGKGWSDMKFVGQRISFIFNLRLNGVSISHWFIFWEIEPTQCTRKYHGHEVMTSHSPLHYTIIIIKNNNKNNNKPQALYIQMYKQTENYVNCCSYDISVNIDI